jgi:capsular polysaccharide biosynthesis protein
LSREVPPGEPHRHPQFVADAELVVPRVAVAELPGGRVLGPDRVVIDRRDTMIEEFGGMYWGTTRWSEHRLFWHPFPDPPVEVDGTLGVLAGRGDLSWYHFLLDIVPRLALLEMPGVPTPERWYAPLGHDWQREVLELLGFLPQDDVVDADVVTHVRAETLLVPGMPDVDMRTPPWAVEFLRERLRPPGLEVVPGRRLYLTRGRTRHNRIVRNEAEVVELLSERGFTVVDTGTLTVAEEIRMFAEAEWIVGPHGGAMTNIVFASAGASVVEFFAPDYVQGCYFRLADCIPGLGYRYLIGAGRSPRSARMNGVMSDITVDLAALERAIDSLPVGPEPAELHH